MLFLSIFLTILGGILISAPVLAYIDPGTTGTVGGALSAIFPVILVWGGFLIRPIKKAIVFLFKKEKKISKQQSQKYP